MSELGDLERKTFRAAKDTGLWDVMAAAVVAMFAIAPLLSESMGDLWSTVVFLPVWLVVYACIRVVRETIIEPRIGTIEVGEVRRVTLRRVGVVLLVVNVVALVAGVAAFVGLSEGWLGYSGLAYPIGLGIAALVLLSAAAYMTAIWRFAAYGLLLAAAPLIGEWLWRNGLASHHGYPLVFGAVTAIMLLVGVGRAAWLIRSHPMPHDRPAA